MLYVQVGSPVIELFLKRNAEGELQQQGTALSISPEVLSKMHSSLGESMTKVIGILLNCRRQCLRCQQITLRC